jgi:hypothetical protein
MAEIRYFVETFKRHVQTDIVLHDRPPSRCCLADQVIDPPQPEGTPADPSQALRLTLAKDLLETGDLLVSDVTRRVEDLRFGGNFNRLKNLMARNDGVQAIELGHDDRAPLRPPRSQRCGQLGPSVQRIGALASLDLHELANDFELFCLGKSRDEFVLGLSTAPYTAPPSWPMQVLVPTLSTGDVVVMARTSALMSRMIK